MKHPLLKKLTWWLYQQDLDLINSPSRKSQDYFILQAIFGSAFLVLTGGQFLSGFAIYLGVPDELVGYIPLISSITGIFLVFLSIFIERFSSRKKLTLIFNSINKPIIISIAFIPLIVPKNLQVLVFFIGLTVAYILNAMMGLAINSWFVNVIPSRIRGRYYSLRQIYAVIVSATLPIMAGRIMDMVKDPYIGFIILYSIAFVMFLGENYAYQNIEDTVVERVDRSQLKLKDLFMTPIKNREFMEYTIMLAIFYLLFYLSVSFTQLYMLRYLELSYTFISFMTTINAFVQIYMYSKWGRFGDRQGHKFIIEVSIGFFAAEMLLWALVTKETMYIFIPIIYVIASISNSGFAVGVFNRRYDIIPEKGRSLYDGFFSMVIGLVLLVAPWIGNKIRGLVSSSEFLQQNVKFGEFRIGFAISALGIILLQLFKLILKRDSPTVKRLFKKFSK